MTESDYDPTSEYYQHFLSDTGCRAFIGAQRPTTGILESFACTCGGCWAVKLDRPAAKGGHPLNGAIRWPACPHSKDWPTGRRW
jgi:hypothetical protein